MSASANAARPAQLARPTSVKVGSSTKPAGSTATVESSSTTTVRPSAGVHAAGREAGGQRDDRQQQHRDRRAVRAAAERGADADQDLGVDHRGGDHVLGPRAGLDPRLQQAVGEHRTPAAGSASTTPIQGIAMRNAMASEPYMTARGFASRRSMSSSRSRWSGVGHSQVPRIRHRRVYRQARPIHPAAGAKISDRRTGRQRGDERIRLDGRRRPDRLRHGEPQTGRRGGEGAHGAQLCARALASRWRNLGER